ncbi:MAG: ABC transporter permease [Chloroflexi bacterium]|nr:ABC transporter permease [Chloroflexota bacterium]
MASRRLRALLTTAAVCLGVVAIMGSLSAIGAIRASLERAAADAAGRADLEVRALAEQGFPLAVVEQVRGLEGVRLVAPVLEKRTFLRGEGLQGFVHLVGVDAAAEAEVHSLALRAGRWPGPGAAEVALLDAWAAGHDIRLGTTVDLITREGFQSFEVVGLVSEAGLARRSFGRVVFVSLQTAQQAFGLGGRITHLALQLERPAEREQVARQLATLLPGGFSALQPEEVGRELRAAAEQLALGLIVFGATALFVGAFLIGNTIAMTVAEQRRQIGLLRAAGVTRGQVLVVVLLQAAVVGAAGSALGVLGGVALAYGLVAWLVSWERLATVEVPLEPQAAALSFLVGVGATVLSALLPAWQATTIAPVEALRHAEPQPTRVSAWSHWLGAGGLVVAGGAALAWPLGEDAAGPARILGVVLWLSAAGLAALGLVGPLSRLCALPFRWLLGPEARLAELNLRRAEQRAGLTVVGFTASLALMVALAGLGSSAATAGQERAARIFPGELLVVSPVPQPVQLADEVRATPGVGHLTLLRPLSVAWGPVWLDAMAVEPADYAAPLAAMLAEGEPAETLARLQAGRAVLVPLRLAQARGLKPGDRMPLQTPDGPVEFQVAGLLAYSFPSSDNLGAVVLSRQDVARSFGLDSFTLLAVTPAPGTSAEALAEPLGQVAERFGMEVVSVGAIRAAIGSGVGQLLALFGSLIAVGIVVAGLGIVNTMMMNVAERQREIGVLRALGLTRWQVQVMVLAEAAMMGLIGGLLGVVSGLGLSRLLLELARSPDFDPQPVWPLGPAALSLLASVAVAMLSALPPARAAARVHVSRAVFTE